jgi:hypothetical protein
MRIRGMTSGAETCHDEESRESAVAGVLESHMYV